MTNEEIAVKITENEQRSKSNTKRLDRLEADHDALSRLATAVEVIATNQKNMSDKINKIDKKVDQLEAVPSDRWKALIGYIVAAAVSALFTLLIHNFG